MSLTLTAFCTHISKGIRCGKMVYLAVKPGDVIPPEFRCHRHKEKARRKSKLKKVA